MKFKLVDELVRDNSSLTLVKGGHLWLKLSVLQKKKTVLKKNSQYYRIQINSMYPSENWALQECHFIYSKLVHNIL